MYAVCIIVPHIQSVPVNVIQFELQVIASNRFEIRMGLLGRPVDGTFIHFNFHLCNQFEMLTILIFQIRIWTGRTK